MLILFAAAFLGHLILMTANHNWWYGLPMPHRATDAMHLVHLVLVLAFPVVVWATFGPDLAGLYDVASGPAWSWALAAYLGLCWATVGVVFPAITLRRLFRGRPAVVVAEHSKIVDIEKHLGRRPLGDGKHRYAGLLPGNEIFQLDLVERTLRLPRLPPALDGFTILHISDLHFCGTPEQDWFKAVMDRCAAWRPDLVALTGDVAEGENYFRWVIPVLGRLRWNVAGFAILGNHDSWYDPPRVRRRLARIGMRVLANRWERLDVRGEQIAVIGHEGPWFGPPPELSDCDPALFRICLSHTPDNLRWARRAGVDLMLSGHVHGGQIRFPVIGSVFVPSRYGRRYDRGVFAEAPTVLHVSRGLSGDHPVRYLCRPEATLLTLRRHDGAEPTP
jgi:predicted MPP superfamily phosphohydrolase